MRLRQSALAAVPPDAEFSANCPAAVPLKTGGVWGVSRLIFTEIRGQAAAVAEQGRVGTPAIKPPPISGRGGVETDGAAFRHKGTPNHKISSQCRIFGTRLSREAKGGPARVGRLPANKGHWSHAKTQSRKAKSPKCGGALRSMMAGGDACPTNALFWFPSFAWKPYFFRQAAPGAIPPAKQSLAKKGVPKYNLGTRKN